MSETQLHWNGLFMIVGAVLFGTAVVNISLRPVVGQIFSTTSAWLLLLSAILLLVSIPGMYASQAAAAGWPGFVGYILLQAGIVLLVVIAATPILYPSLKLPTVENPAVFLLGIAFTLGLLLTGIATVQAGVFPRWSGILLLAVTAGFFFSFFIAEYLPPMAGQVGSALLGVVLALSLGWIGFLMWSAS